MGYSYVIDAARGLVTVTYHGEVDLHELCRSTEDVWSDPTFHKKLNAISDFSEITKLSVSIAEIRSLSEFHQSNASKALRGRVAVVAGQPDVFGMFRMWEIVTRNVPFSIMVFRSRDDAMAWLFEGRLSNGDDGDLPA